MALQTSALSLSPRVLAVFQDAAAVLKPPPPSSVSQWAERCRVLSTESSAEPGRYRTARAPYQRGMQNAVNLPGVEEIVYFTSAQIGKSLCLENILGYFMQEDPSPIIWMWPTLEVAKSWSIDTLQPMLRDTTTLCDLTAEGGRKSSNSTLFKKFPGGWLAVIGANSPGTLRRRRARILIADEVDAYNASAGPEGDPIMLVAKRSTTFWNRLRILSSTTTLKGASRIDAAYDASDRRKYWVPCPHCSQAAGHDDGFQVLQFKRLIWDKPPAPETTVYPCEHCGAALTEFDKPWMLEHGEWRPERPEVLKIAGFWINELYSPFVTWAEMATAFLSATAHRENPEMLKTFVNLSLAEPYEIRDEQIDVDDLRKRVEDYEPHILPRGVAVLTAGVDVQADRLEVELVGWGRGEESWSIDFARFDGDTGAPDVWQKLDEYLVGRWWHSLAPDDLSLEIAAVFVDSGFRAANVYAFTKTRGDRRVFASKGMSGFNRPPVMKWNRNNQARVKLYPVSVDVVKELIYSRIRVPSPGPGYMHFSRAKNLNESPEYFDQLTAEKIERKNKHGYPVRYWVLPPGKRNEALDCRVLATAALHSLVDRTPVPVMLDHLYRSLCDRAKDLLAKRRERTDPNQLELLHERAAVRVPMEPVSGDAGMRGPQGEDVPPAGEGQAEQLPDPVSGRPQGGDEPQRPPQGPPAVRRRSSWI
jgi:phage terminase large subunit GpA-like protein